VSPDEHSPRFIRAATAELGRIQRRLDQLASRRHSLEKTLRELAREMETLARRARTLEELTGDEATVIEGPSTAPTGIVIRGAAIRETAVRVLAEHAEATSPIHYRRWLDLLEEAGYQVVGKRPEAVFLGQVKRSPLVRASTKSGYYSLDLATSERLRSRLAQAQAELRQTIASVRDESTDLDQAQVRQRQLNVEIAQLRRALDEVERVLPPEKREQAAA
jgi:hypothetical protein